MKKLLLSLIAALPIGAALGLPATYVLNSSNTPTVSIDPTTLGYTIPCNFVGFSFEESSIVQALSLNNNSALKSSMSAMGACSHIRFGGNSADTNTPLSSRIPDAANFTLSFNGGAGWNSIYTVGCPLNYQNTATAVSQASAYKGVAGSQATIAVGNEPNYYTSTIGASITPTITAFTAGTGGTGSISIAGNSSAQFYAGQSITISGSNSNNATFTVVSASYSSPSTTILLSQTVAADTSTTAIATASTIANSCNTFSGYQTAWQAVKTAVAGSISTSYESGDVGVNTATPTDNYSPLIASAFGSQLGYLSVHSYCTTLGTSTLADVQAAWVSSATVNEITTIKSNSSVAASGLNLRLTETGCSTVGGNVLGSSLFQLWQMQLLAQNTWLGINFHMSDGYSTSEPSYVPLLKQGDGSYYAQPTMYAMLMFNNLAQCQIEAMTTTLPSNVTALAAKCTNGKSKVLIVNRSIASYQPVQILSTVSFSTMDSLVYTGTSYAATTVSLGYSAISNAGVYTPQTYRVPNVVNVPPSSAILVTLNP